MQNIQLEKIRAMDRRQLSQFAAECESRFERQFIDAFDLILKNNVKILFLAGPSCSGKTTSTKKLAGHMQRFGKKAVTVSTDDFFLDISLAPKNRNGTPNYESFDFIDSDLLLDTVEKICRGEPYFMPTFDFQSKKRLTSPEPAQAAGNELIIVEGIHALNDKFITECRHRGCAGVYICPDESIGLDGRILLEKDDIRFLRRLVRDFKHRSTAAKDTFAMWENVLEGEDLFITPFIKNADIFINSTFSYEPFIIRDPAIAQLGMIGSDSIFRFKASSLIERLERLFPLDVSLVPEDSLLNEFLR